LNIFDNNWFVVVVVVIVYDIGSYLFVLDYHVKKFGPVK